MTGPLTQAAIRSSGEGSRPSIAIVVTTFNRKRYLEQTIASIIQQDLLPDEVIIIDDGSTDGTLDVIATLKAPFRVYAQANSGKASAANLGLSHVGSDFVCFFDDDDVMYPWFVSTLKEAAIKYPRAGVLFGFHDTAATTGNLLNHQDVPIKRGNYRFSNLDTRRLRVELFRDCVFSLCGAIVKTSVVRELGGFNPDFKRSQDYDLILRLSTKTTFQYCGRNLFLVRVHDGVRGSGSGSHDAKSKIKVWHDYGNRLGRWLEEHTAIVDFAVDDPPYLASLPKLRKLYLCRAWSLAPKRSTRATMRDVSIALHHSSSHPLDADECRWLRECLHDDFVRLKSTIEIFTLFTLLGRPLASEALPLLARGAYWTARGPGSSLLDKLRWGIVSIYLFTLGAFSKICRYIHRSHDE